MIFTYLNNPVVWTKFCDSYNAIYEHMVQFEQWYAVSSLHVPLGWE